MANTGTAWGHIIYDAWNRDLLIIHFSDSSSWKVLYNPPFFSRERCTYNNFCFIILFFLFFFLYFVFNIYMTCFLRSNKTWLSERFSLLSRHELLFLEHFVFYFNVFYMITNFDSQYQHYCYDYCHYYCCYYFFVIVIAIIISSFSMLLTFIILVFIILIYIFV